MGSWQMNGRISRDLLDPTLAWSALPEAPVRPDRRRVMRLSQVRRALGRRAGARRAPAPARAVDAVCTPS